MTVYIQHSYGKSDKITKSIDKHLISGVIFSPKGESSISKMTDTIKEYSDLGVDTYIDPHFHLGLIENCSDNKIKDYPYYKSDLKYKNFISPKALMEHVKICLDFQAGLALSGYYTPTCIIESFEDKWCAVAIQMAQSALEYVDNDRLPNLYVSFVISENAFSGSKESIDDFINIITSLDGLNNVYLIINKNSEAYSPQLESDKLKNIMYLIYALSYNGIKIVCGYSDILGLMYLTAGADVITTGWSQKSRFFSRNNYKEMTGGSTPRPRYMSIPLINSININPELNEIRNFGLLEEVLSHTEYDEIATQTPYSDNWTKVSFYHHLNCIKILSDNLLKFEVDKRIEIMQTKIEQAAILYKKLTGVPFSSNTDSRHLAQWAYAIRGFKEMIL